MKLIGHLKFLKVKNVEVCLSYAAPNSSSITEKDTHNIAVTPPQTHSPEGAAPYSGL